MTSLIRQQIIIVLEENEEIAGTEELADAVNCVNHKSWLRECARKVQMIGHILIIPSNGGRGHKTVYKLNRNQPGLPRRTG